MAPVPPPPPCALTWAGSGGESAETRRRGGWTSLCLHATHTTEPMLQTEANPKSRHDNTKHLSECAQLRYHSVACILIDRHQIEPFAHLAPHLEELDLLAYWD